jgi:hypothetical protein
MSADRRTLITAAVAMVALILVGVVGAQIFTRSACGVIAPEAGSPGVSGSDIGPVLAEALDDLSEEERAQLLAGLEVVAGAGGQVRSATDVGPAVSLTELDGDLVATGETTTVLSWGPDGDVEAVEFDEDATVVGDGDALYVVALVNELTGQVDALAPLGPDVLEDRDCTDTATVGVPLAFHLDAADGRLLLFRVDDDGDGPTLELRGPEGPIWDADLTVGSGPPGVLAERLTARLGEDLVVAARRSLPDEEAPALAAHDLEDGQERWTLGPAELLEHAPSGETALVVRVVAVESDLVVVALSREEDGPEATRLVGLDPADGGVRWSSDVVTDGVPRVVGEIGEDLLMLTGRDGMLEAVQVERGTGEHEVLHATSGQHGAATVVGGGVLLGVDGGVTRVHPGEEVDAVPLPGRVVDLAVEGNQVALLVRSDEGGVVVHLELGDV